MSPMPIRFWARAPTRSLKTQKAVFDTPETASYLAVAEQTLRKMRVDGDGPPFVQMGRAVRYRIVDLDAWIANRVVTSTSQKVAA